MSEIFDKSWFGKISFHMMEYSGDNVGVHVFKAGQECRLFTVQAELFDTLWLWRNLHERALKAWASVQDITGLCPNCKMQRKMWERRYQDRKFCGWCGDPLT
jgi:hypothetical protein